MSRGGQARPGEGHAWVLAEPRSPQPPRPPRARRLTRATEASLPPLPPPSLAPSLPRTPTLKMAQSGQDSGQGWSWSCLVPTARARNMRQWGGKARAEAVRATRVEHGWQEARRCDMPPARAPPPRSSGARAPLVHEPQARMKAWRRSPRQEGMMAVSSTTDSRNLSSPASSGMRAARGKHSKLRTMRFLHA